MPSVALVACAQDEQTAIPAFLAYHEALGVDRAYVYLDRCSDESWEAVEASAIGVPVANDRDLSVRYLAQHQDTCVGDAKVRAADDGLDWLLHVDVDEFAWGEPRDRVMRPDGGDPRHRGDLRAMVARAAAETAVVRLQPLEAIPELGTNVLTDLHHFQTPDRPVPRRMLDPRSGRRVVIQRLLGGDTGTTAVRTAAPLRPAGRRWLDERGDEPAADDLGTVLQFPAVSSRQWRAKYAKLAFEPSRAPGGRPVAFPKQAWKQVTPRMTETEAAEYFTRWVAMAPTEIHGLVERGQVRELPVVAQVLRAVDFTP